MTLLVNRGLFCYAACRTDPKYENPFVRDCSTGSGSDAFAFWKLSKDGWHTLELFRTLLCDRY